MSYKMSLSFMIQWTYITTNCGLLNDFSDAPYLNVLHLLLHVHVCTVINAFMCRIRTSSVDSTCLLFSPTVKIKSYEYFLFLYCSNVEISRYLTVSPVSECDGCGADSWVWKREIKTETHYFDILIIKILSGRIVWLDSVFKAAGLLYNWWLFNY